MASLNTPGRHTSTYPLHPQASSLNYVGFRKLQIRIEESFGGKLSLGGGRPAREEFRSRPFFLQSSDEAPESTKAFFSAITVSTGL